MVDDFDTQYPYVGVPLSPQIIAEIAVKLFAGTVAKIDDIAAKCAAFHEGHGGFVGPVDLDNESMSAMKILESACFTRSLTKGSYRFSRDDVVAPFDDHSLEAVQELESSVLPFPVEQQIGQGPELVYFYTFPAYRELARLRNEGNFPIKIGMSTRPVFDRIFEQLGTSNPEWPVVLLAIRCDDARRIERVLHELLDLQYSHIERSPGNEWFLTSLEEIVSLLSSIAPGLIPPPGPVLDLADLAPPASDAETPQSEPAAVNSSSERQELRLF